MSFYDLKILGLNRKLPVLKTPSGIDIAGFNPVGDMELLMKTGKYLAKQVKKNKIKYDVIMTFKNEDNNKDYIVYTLSNSPIILNLLVSGTFNHKLPSANTIAISVEPIPVENAPNAPCVQVCESAPTITSPGTTWPSSGKIWWQTPALTS